MRAWKKESVVGFLSVPIHNLAPVFTWQWVIIRGMFLLTVTLPAHDFPHTIVGVDARTDCAGS